MENKITLYGASGHCKVIIDSIENSNNAIHLIVDDNPSIKSILGKPVSASTAVDSSKISNVILSIGNNKIRKILSKQLQTNFSKAIHPSAIISNFATVDDGTVIMAGAIINPDTRIGKHCIINTGAIIEHDCSIADFVHISPNASLAGGVSVDEGSHIGIGSVIIQGIKIGKWAIIGAGAVIIKDVPDNAVVVGNPGKIIKYTKENE